MIGLVFAQHVVDEIGREGHLLAGLALSGVLSLHQSADNGHFAERPAQQVRTLHPLDKLVLQDIGRQQGRRVGHGLQTPYRQRIVVGDEPAGHQAPIFHAPRNQHAQALVGVPALERIIDTVMALGMREALDEQLPRPRHSRTPVLNLEPFAHIVGKPRPARTVDEHCPYPVCQMRGQRHTRAAIAGDHRAGLRRLDQHFHVLELDHFEAHSGKGEGIAGTERCREAFLDLTQASATATTPCGDPDLEHFGIDDDSGVHPVALCLFRMRQPPDAILVADNALELVVGP